MGIRRVVIGGPSLERGALPIACMAIVGLAALAAPLALCFPWFPDRARGLEPLMVLVSLAGLLGLFLALPLVAGVLFQRTGRSRFVLGHEGVVLRDGFGATVVPWTRIASYRESDGFIELVVPDGLPPSLFLPVDDDARAQEVFAVLEARGLRRADA